MPLTLAENYDAELRRLNDRFCAATGIRRTDCVLDIGCGTGQTSRDAARAAVAGEVLGADVSEQLLERAHERTAAEGLRTITDELGYAQVHPLVWWRSGRQRVNVALTTLTVLVARALSAPEHGPADVVPYPLVVEDELANRLREMIALPPALEFPCAFALSFRSGSTGSLDRIGGRTELVRRHVCDDRRLAGSVGGMACWPAQVSGRGHGMATRRASLGHRDLAIRPGAGLLDGLARSPVVRPNQFEPVEDVLGARCRPQGEEMVIRIGESSTAADRHETRVTVFGEDHSQHPFCATRDDSGRWMGVGGSPDRIFVSISGSPEGPFDEVVAAERQPRRSACNDRWPLARIDLKHLFLR